ncbi:MAG: hypothetical protein V3W34_14710 [Phycisphaerae bacterium]
MRHYTTTVFPADVADATGLLANWDPCLDSPQTCPGDLDGEGTVGILDVLALRASWGAVPIALPTPRVR